MLGVSEMQILATTDFSTRSQRAVRRAGLLAQASGAKVTLLHVVDDDQPQDLVEVERREAERIIAEQISAIAELQGVNCRPMVVSGDPFDGILRASAALKAELIVMGAHRKQLLRDIFVGTTVERVIRTGPYPVLMVNSEAKVPYRMVLAPIDLSEPSANAVRVARATELTEGTHGSFLYAFAPVAMARASLDRATIAEYTASERRKAAEELAAFLVEHQLADIRWSLCVDEGGAFEVISRAVEGTRPDLLVIGTHGRGGLAKVLLGSVTEEALRSLNVDILAVPPLR